MTLFSVMKERLVRWVAGENQRLWGKHGKKGPHGRIEHRIVGVGKGQGQKIKREPIGLLGKRIKSLKKETLDGREINEERKGNLQAKKLVKSPPKKETTKGKREQKQKKNNVNT